MRRLVTAQENTDFSPEMSLSLTLFGEIGLPVLGLTEARRKSLKATTFSGVT